MKCPNPLTLKTWTPLKAEKIEGEWFSFEER